MFSLFHNLRNLMYPFSSLKLQIFDSSTKMAFVCTEEGTLCTYVCFFL